MPPKEESHLYAAAPLSWRNYRLCRAPAVLSSSVFAYKSDTVVDLNGASTAGGAQNVYMQDAIADHVVMIVKHFLERAWLWSRKRLEDMPHCDLQMVECWCSVLYLLLSRATDRVRRVELRHFVSERGISWYVLFRQFYFWSHFTGVVPA